MVPNIEEIIKNQANNLPENLIPLLQEVQDQFGYLNEEAVVKIGEYLKIPTSKIYGIATFYDQFNFEPKGKVEVKVCRGTTCHVLDSSNVLKEFEKILRIRTGQTSRDSAYSLRAVNCLGACGIGPVVCINGKYFSGVTPNQVKGIVATFNI